MDIETQDQYFAVLKEAIQQTEEYIKHYPEINMYQSILNQLVFIQNVVMIERRIPTEDEVEKLTLGSIAVKNFDYENDPYADLLMDCYSKCLRYTSLRPS